MPTHSIHISAKKTNRFKYSLNHSVHDVHSVFVSNARIPISYYNVEAKKNAITIKINGTNYVSTIEPGNYDITELVEAVQSKLTSLNMNINPRLTHSKITGKVSFRVDEDQNVLNLIQVFTGDVTAMLGFTKDSQYFTSVTGDSVVNMIHKSLYLMLDNCPQIDSEMKGIKSSVVYEANINQPSFGLFCDSTSNIQIKQLNKPKSFSTLAFSLVDKDYNVIDLNGSSYEFTINLIHHD